MRQGAKHMRQAHTLLLFIFALVVFPSSAKPQAVPGLDATVVASGLTSPVFAAAPPGDYNRLFIVQQDGVIRILDLTTNPPSLKAAPFLTIPGMAGGEQGLLGLAFHPNYAANGKFYVHHVAAGSNDIVIERRQVSSNPDLADTTAATIKTVLTFSHPQGNHNAGWIGFGPRPGDESNLYISSGDGGNGDDAGIGHIEPGGNAQNNTTLLGKMLRITVNPTTETPPYYTIPPDNPFANAAPSPSPAPMKEIWLLGLRNPYRDSFDRMTGRMFIGDVGQSSREEIDVQHPTNPGGGENYGWRDREGLIQNPTYATTTPTPTPVPPRVDPIYDYPRTGTLGGRTVVGGYVYRGKQIPALNGVYVFADYLGTSGSGPGKVFTLNYDGGPTASNPQNITAQLFPTIDNPSVNLANPSSLGEDANGELYITDIGNGSVYKIVPVTPNVVITSITRDPMNGPVHLRGMGVPFRNHAIQTTADLTQPFSTPGTIVVAAADGSITFDDPAPGAMRFYRIVYPPPP
jgi:glucose/arabinose dehydrogenase